MARKGRSTRSRVFRGKVGNRWAEGTSSRKQTPEGVGGGGGNLGWLTKKGRSSRIPTFRGRREAEGQKGINSRTPKFREKIVG